MYDATLLRKIEAPALPSVILHRKALVAHLQKTMVGTSHSDGSDHHCKLVLLCAPAGYGKTTLLADFARTTPLPCCWYFLDQADTDPVVFLLTLLDSLRRVFPSFGQHLDSRFRNLFSKENLSSSDISSPAIDAICTAIAEDIPEAFALFLCNFEEINESQSLTGLVNSLLKKLPRQTTLVIESRVIPDLFFASLLMREEMSGFDSSALRFSAQEIAELARLQGFTTLSDAEAEQLTTSFDGWIAGILLGTYLGDLRFLLPHQHDSSDQNISWFSARQKRTNLFTYLVNEVFQRDTVIHTFLREASILQQIEPTLCNTLLKRTDAAECLVHLQQQGLFITSYENVSHTIYTCHPVIRDLLSEQLRQQEPERFTALHRQAAELWHANQNYEQAMYHAHEAGASDLQVQLFLEAYHLLLHQGKLEMLSRWLRALPPTILQSRPELFLVQANIALARGQYASAFPLLEQATLLMPDEDAAGTSSLQAELHILRAKALCQAGEYAQAQLLCQQVLLHLPLEEKELRPAAEMCLGICFNLQGNFSAGIVHLRQALHIWANSFPPNQAIDIYSALANTYYLMGNIELATHYLTHALDVCEHMHDTPRQVHNLILRGIIAQSQGLYSDAETTFLQTLTLARAVPDSRRGEAYVLTNLGSLYLEQEKYTQALTFAAEGLALAHQWGNRSLVNAALSNLALIHLFLGDPVSALHYVEKMEVPALHATIASYEQVWRELTYGTILLAQGRSQEAYLCLSEIEAALSLSDLKQGIFQAKLRLAACQIARSQSEDAVRLLEEVASHLTSSHSYTHLVRLELRWLPTLLPIVQQHPQLAHLRTLLGLDEPAMPDPSSSDSAVAEVRSPLLTIRAFGEPAVLIDEQLITRWRMARAKELFFFLLDLDRPISKETILTALWPTFDDQTNQAFHSTLHYLRKLLGEACIVFRADGYRLNLAACYGEQVSYDVKEFQQYRLEANQALALHDEANAREALLKMVELYRGDYGQPFYSDWCTARRDELRAAYLEALRQLAQIAWRAEAWDKSAEHFLRMLRLDNCLEEAHYGLMRCYVRQGKRGAALRQYQSCQKTLQQELGIQPGPALQTLYQRLTAK